MGVHLGCTLIQPGDSEARDGSEPLAFTAVLLFCRGYLIAAPSVFRSGVEEVISVTIFNSPREVMVQAQLVAQGEAVAQSQGAILGRSLGCLTRPSPPFAKWSLGLRQCRHCFASFPPHLQNPGRSRRTGCILLTLQMERVRPSRGSHLPSLGNQSSLFLSSSGSVGADLDRFGHPFVPVLARRGKGAQREPCDLFRSFVELLAPLWC